MNKFTRTTLLCMEWMSAELLSSQVNGGASFLFDDKWINKNFRIFFSFSVSLFLLACHCRANVLFSLYQRLCLFGVRRTNACTLLLPLPMLVTRYYNLWCVFFVIPFSPCKHTTSPNERRMNENNLLRYSIHKFRRTFGLKVYTRRSICSL